MTDIFGRPPGTTSTLWQPSWTFYDLSAELPAGEVITHLGFYSDPPRSQECKIGKRISSNVIQTAYSEVLAHPGGGYGFMPISSPFTIPGPGYFMGIHATAPEFRRSLNGARAAEPANVPLGQSATFDLATTGMPCLCARTQGGDPPPPPPPPPEGTPVDCFFVGPAQSNALNFGSGSAFKSRYLELAPGPRAVEFKNYAVGSTFLRPFPGSPHWDPNVSPNLLVPALADFKAFVLADPLRVAKGGIMYIGESCGEEGREVNALHHMTDALARVQYVRAYMGNPTLPYVIVELHAPPAGWENWADVQFGQRMNCSDADGYGRIPNAHLVSAANLGGGVLHLGGADLATLQQRIAEKFASVLFP